MNRCQYPLDDASHECCDRLAAWETDDLQAVHFLCEEHCTEALRWNDFGADEVSS